jgi:anti-anti-sigma regulatory factor
MITIDKNEQYASININAENIDEILTKDIEKSISGLFRGGYGNFIIDLKIVNSVEEPFITLIKKVEMLTKNENGLLVIVSENDEIINHLDESKITDLVILPTKEEAIEAVYINELENDFREEEDEETDEFGEDAGNDFE